MQQVQHQAQTIQLLQEQDRHREQQLQLLQENLQSRLFATPIAPTILSHPSPISMAPGHVPEPPASSNPSVNNPFVITSPSQEVEMTYKDVLSKKDKKTMRNATRKTSSKPTTAPITPRPSPKKKPTATSQSSPTTPTNKQPSSTSRRVTKATLLAQIQATSSIEEMEALVTRVPHPHAAIHSVGQLILNHQTLNAELRSIFPQWLSKHLALHHLPQALNHNMISNTETEVFYDRLNAEDLVYQDSLAHSSPPVTLTENSIPRRVASYCRSRSMTVRRANFQGFDHELMLMLLDKAEKSLFRLSETARARWQKFILLDRQWILSREYQSEADFYIPPNDEETAATMTEQ